MLFIEDTAQVFCQDSYLTKILESISERVCIRTYCICNYFVLLDYLICSINRPISLYLLVNLVLFTFTFSFHTIVLYNSLMLHLFRYSSISSRFSHPRFKILRSFQLSPFRFLCDIAFLYFLSKSSVAPVFSFF